MHQVTFTNKQLTSKPPKAGKAGKLAPQAGEYWEIQKPCNQNYVEKVKYEIPNNILLSRRRVSIGKIIPGLPYPNPYLILSRS